MKIYHLMDEKGKTRAGVDNLDLAVEIVALRPGWSHCNGCDEETEATVAFDLLLDSIFINPTPASFSEQLSDSIKELERRKQERRSTPYFDGPDIGAGVGGYAEAPVVNEYGAKRGTDLAEVPLHMLPRHALHAWAKRFALGVKKYGKNNWLRGFPISTLIDHAMDHLIRFNNGDRTEDNLGAALWNIGTAIEFMKTRPELDDILTQEQRDGIASNKHQHQSENGNSTDGRSGVKSPRTGAGFESIR